MVVPRQYAYLDLRGLFLDHLTRKHNAVLVVEGGLYELIRWHTNLHFTKVCDHGIWLPDLEGNDLMATENVEKLQQAYPTLQRDQLEVLDKFQSWVENLSPTEKATFQRIPGYETYVTEIFAQQIMQQRDGSNVHPTITSDSDRV